MKYKQEILMLLGFFGAVLTIFSFGLGIAAGIHQDECRYKNIITKFNPAYIVGCELAKPRFE